MPCPRLSKGIKYFGSTKGTWSHDPSAYTFSFRIQFTQPPNEGFIWSFRTKCPHSNITSRKEQNGPLLITHRGFSGPAILKASAWDAEQLAGVNYKFEVLVNWLGSYSSHDLADHFKMLRNENSKQRVSQNPFPEIPKRLWGRLVSLAQIENDTTWAHLSVEKNNYLQNNISAMHFKVDGKTTNKEEFVTCGGICLKEVDFRRMESKLTMDFSAGRMPKSGRNNRVDSIFQAAWTTGRIAGQSMGKTSEKNTSA